MEISSFALEIIDKLNKASFEAYLVGGCVRDMLMGKPPKDWDITTSATPEEVKSIFDKTFDTGIEHGTVTVVIGGGNYEVTTYRIDGDYKDFRHPEEVAFTQTLKEDLLRRDFTMNAIAYHPDEGYVDYFGGKEDIERKIIKGVGDPVKRFNEDALRMMRAVRFACQLGFDIENETFGALKNNSSLIAHVSIERIRDELLKAFTGGYSEKGSYFLKCNILYEALPFMAGYIRENISEFLERLNAFESEAKTAVNVLTLLLKNMNGSEIKSCLKNLKIDNASARSILNMSPLVNKPIAKDSFEIKEVICNLGFEDYFNLLQVKQARGEDISWHRDEALRIINMREPVFMKDMAVNGDMLMERFGISGKATGDVLRALHREILKNPAMNHFDNLMELASCLVNKLFG